MSKFASKDLFIFKEQLRYMQKLTKREAERLRKLIRAKKLGKRDVEEIGGLLNKFCLILVEAKELSEKIKKLDEKIDKAIKTRITS